MKKYNTGFVLGKFCPLHKGHLLLINKALEASDRLYIVVDNIMDDVISVAKRMEWVQSEYPTAIVLTQKHPLPQDPSETPDFWNIWHTELMLLLPESIDAVFASETYGERLAKELSADFVMVDLQRITVPISARDIRTNILGKWDYLATSVQHSLRKTVCVFGPESTGKSTLTKQLADYFKAPYIKEYAKTVIEEKRGHIVYDDMETIVKGHHEAISKALESPTHPLLFVDTDAIASKIWSIELFGKESPIIEEYISLQSFDLYLLLDIDLPWVDDIHRYRPNNRQYFFNKCEKQLISRSKNYVIIRGEGGTRLQNAISAVRSIIKP
ncbi:MAG: AAA family ATPase [Prevotellaceae bacterium]|nr:AAA family ATPase [Prevotellaceae bacterium]MDO4931120.1 AAA family ATPase [Prevotellaceae bacterium]